MQSNVGGTVPVDPSQSSPNASSQANEPDVAMQNTGKEREESVPQHISQEQAQDIPADQDPDDPASP